MSAYAVVDSGTTTTRLRLWHDGRVSWSGSLAAGARDTAMGGDNRAIREAVADLLARVTAETGARPSAVICSGMITSNLGLYEVPHLAAPAGPDELAAGIVHTTIDGVGDVSFIPGIKTLPASLTLETLAAGDVLRGEEAEVTGLRTHLGLSAPATFLHFGSHHKAVDVDGAGRITASRTAVTGELLAAALEHTILRSSVVPLTDLALDLEAMHAGARATRAHGLGRALFLVRVGEQIAGMERTRMTSFLIGALAALDGPLLPPPSAVATIVLYGHGAFPEALAALLERDGYDHVVRVDGETTDRAAVEGAVALFERARDGRA
ncbi:MAG: 2-dehydro-3-deoxygalactonokinase [Trueperaceae bacterium]|nr:2-dehydro-3-deoxygalactonokinase [Trueperaceae bacterium]